MQLVCWPWLGGDVNYLIIALQVMFDPSSMSNL